MKEKITNRTWEILTLQNIFADLNRCSEVLTDLKVTGPFEDVRRAMLGGIEIALFDAGAFIPETDEAQDERLELEQEELREIEEERQHIRVERENIFQGL